MSEIRLADDDKDRKYRVRINENGEEEIEIIQREDEPEEEEPDFITFQDEMEDEEQGDEEARELMRAAKEEQERLAKEEAQGYIEKAKARIAEGDVQFALVALDSAQQAWEEEWEIYPLKLELLTNYFTDFTKTEECVTLGDGYLKYVPEDVREQFGAKYAANITAELEKRQQAAQKVKAENEQKKQERRVRFTKRRNASLKNFLIALVPFIILLGVAIGLSPYMIYDTGIMAGAIILYVLAAAAFVLCVILLRFLARDMHRLKLNELDTSTKIGREYIENNELAEALKEFYDIIMYKPAEKKAEYAAIIDGEVTEL